MSTILSSTQKKWLPSAELSADEAEHLATDTGLQKDECVFLGHLASKQSIAMAASAVKQTAHETFEQATQDLLKLQNAKGAISRFIEAVQKGEHIGISSDYDCDGNTSAAILRNTLMALGHPEDKIHIHIPNREEEGYGVNEAAVKRFHDEGCSLMITLDNGIGAQAPIAAASTLGMDTIVLDHHPNKPESMPPAQAGDGKVWVVDANQASECYKKSGNGYRKLSHFEHAAPELKTLCAASLTWFFARAVMKAMPQGVSEDTQRMIEDQVAYAGLATVADVVPLPGLVNRMLVKDAVVAINSGHCPPINLMLRMAGKDVPVTEDDFAFSLGPMVNAPGRLGHSIAWKLFSTPELYDIQSNRLISGTMQRKADAYAHDLADVQSMEEMSARLSSFMDQAGRSEDKKDHVALQLWLAALSKEANDKRKQFEGKVYQEADAMAKTYLQANPDAKSLFLCSPDWHPGLIGIVASRIKDKYNLPALVGSVDEDGFVKASGRSIESESGVSVDLGQAVSTLRTNKVLKGGGGHPAAVGGVAFHVDDLESVRKHFDELLAAEVNAVHSTQSYAFAGVLTPEQVSPSLVRMIRERLGPFGKGNPMPRFAIRATLHDVIPSADEQQRHPKLILQGETGVRMETRAFFHGNTALGEFLNQHANQGEMCEFLGTLGVSDNGKVSFKVEDARLLGENATVLPLLEVPETLSLVAQEKWRTVSPRVDGGLRLPVTLEPVDPQEVRHLSSADMITDLDKLKALTVQAYQEALGVPLDCTSPLLHHIEGGEKTVGTYKARTRQEIEAILMRHPLYKDDPDLLRQRVDEECARSGPKQINDILPQSFLETLLDKRGNPKEAHADTETTGLNPKEHAITQYAMTYPKRTTKGGEVDLHVSECFCLPWKPEIVEYFLKYAEWKGRAERGETHEPPPYYDRETYEYGISDVALKIGLKINFIREKPDGSAWPDGPVTAMEVNGKRVRAAPFYTMAPALLKELPPELIFYNAPFDRPMINEKLKDALSFIHAVENRSDFFNISPELQKIALQEARKGLMLDGWTNSSKWQCALFNFIDTFGHQPRNTLDDSYLFVDPHCGGRGRHDAAEDIVMAMAVSRETRECQQAAQVVDFHEIFKRRLQDGGVNLDHGQTRWPRRNGNDALPVEGDMVVSYDKDAAASNSTLHMFESLVTAHQRNRRMPGYLLPMETGRNGRQVRLLNAERMKPLTLPLLQRLMFCQDFLSGTPTITRLHFHDSASMVDVTCASEGGDVVVQDVPLISLRRNREFISHLPPEQMVEYLQLLQHIQKVSKGMASAVTLERNGDVETLKIASHLREQGEVVIHAPAGKRISEYAAQIARKLELGLKLGAIPDQSNQGAWLSEDEHDLSDAFESQMETKELATGVPRCGIVFSLDAPERMHLTISQELFELAAYSIGCDAAEILRSGRFGNLKIASIQKDGKRGVSLDGSIDDFYRIFPEKDAKAVNLVQLIPNISWLLYRLDHLPGTRQMRINLAKQELFLEQPDGLSLETLFVLRESRLPFLVSCNTDNPLDCKVRLNLRPLLNRPFDAALALKHSQEEYDKMKSKGIDNLSDPMDYPQQTNIQDFIINRRKLSTLHQQLMQGKIRSLRMDGISSTTIRDKHNEEYRLHMDGEQVSLAFTPDGKLDILESSVWSPLSVSWQTQANGDLLVTDDAANALLYPRILRGIAHERAEGAPEGKMSLLIPKANANAAQQRLQAMLHSANMFTHPLSPARSDVEWHGITPDGEVTLATRSSTPPVSGFLAKESVDLLGKLHRGPTSKAISAIEQKFIPMDSYSRRSVSLHALEQWLISHLDELQKVDNNLSRLATEIKAFDASHRLLPLEGYLLNYVLAHESMRNREASDDASIDKFYAPDSAKELQDMYEVVTHMRDGCNSLEENAFTLTSKLGFVHPAPSSLARYLADLLLALPDGEWIDADTPRYSDMTQLKAREEQMIQLLSRLKPQESAQELISDAYLDRAKEYMGCLAEVQSDEQRQALSHQAVLLLTRHNELEAELHPTKKSRKEVWLAPEECVAVAAADDAGREAAEHALAQVLEALFLKQNVRGAAQAAQRSARQWSALWEYQQTNGALPDASRDEMVDRKYSAECAQLARLYARHMACAYANKHSSTDKVQLREDIRDLLSTDPVLIDLLAGAGMDSSQLNSTVLKATRAEYADVTKQQDSALIASLSKARPSTVQGLLFHQRHDEARSMLENTTQAEYRESANRLSRSFPVPFRELNMRRRGQTLLTSTLDELEDFRHVLYHAPQAVQAGSNYLLALSRDHSRDLPESVTRVLDSVRAMEGTHAQWLAHLEVISDALKRVELERLVDILRVHKVEPEIGYVEVNPDRHTITFPPGRLLEFPDGKELEKSWRVSLHKAAPHPNQSNILLDKDFKALVDRTDGPRRARA